MRASKCELLGQVRNSGKCLLNSPQIAAKLKIRQDHRAAMIDGRALSGHKPGTIDVLAFLERGRAVAGL
jgi:hypothetical protein